MRHERTDPDARRTERDGDGLDGRRLRGSSHARPGSGVLLVTLADSLKARAADLGFLACGITDPSPPPHADKLDAWQDVRFGRIFKGDDWRGTPKGAALEERLGAVGVEVVYFPYTMHTSSTMLRRAVQGRAAVPQPHAVPALA